LRPSSAASNMPGSSMKPAYSISYRLKTLGDK
jgi:hypothetical protein